MDTRLIMGNRLQVLARVKAEIANGRYDDRAEHRIRGVVDRLLPILLEPEGSVPQDTERTMVNSKKPFTPLTSKRSGMEARENV